jgi:AcrR family transcriptional regulator
MVKVMPSTTPDKTRVRRHPDDARRLILAAAEALLVEGGPSAVTVRAVAERMEMTDAGIHHHFGSRNGLHEALLRKGGRRLRDELKRVTGQWLEEGTHVLPLVIALAAFYRSGYSQLAIALHAAGWREHGSGLLQPVVDALHAARPRRADGSAADPLETQLALAALHQALAVDPTYGAAFRRSAGLTGRAASDASAQVQWWAHTLAQLLGLPV